MAIRGHLDVLRPGFVAGWARDPARPEAAVELFVWIDGRLAARTLANRPRPDLVKAGFGDGRHAFEAAFAGPAAGCTVRVTDADGRDVAGSPRTLPASGWPTEPADGGITILAIAKHEGPYLEEWIAYHHAIGVDRFLLYDNGHPDGATRALRANPALAGIVEVVDWPDTAYPPTRGPQPAAYEHAIPALQRQGGWVAVIDIDEFIVPLVDPDLPALLARFADVPAVAFAWKLFGSSGHARRDDDRLVTERFRFAGTSPLVKSVARASAIRRIDCHAPALAGGAVVDERRRPILDSARTIAPTYRWAQVNHYFTKSWNEWVDKRERGRADFASMSLRQRRTDDDFFTLDAASHHDRAIDRFHPKLTAMLQRLFPARAARADEGAARQWPAVPLPSRLRPLTAGPAAGRCWGFVESPRSTDGLLRCPSSRSVRLAGWLFRDGGGGDGLLRLRSLEPAAASDHVLALRRGIERPDVAAHFPHLPADWCMPSGFDMTADLRGVPHGRYHVELGVVADGSPVWAPTTWRLVVHQEAREPAPGGA